MIAPGHASSAGLARDLKFKLTTPWKKLSEEVRTAVMRGDNFEVKVKWKNRYGREMSYTSGFEGVVPYIERQFLQADTDFNPHEVARILRDLAANLEDARTSTGGALRDCNGDIVGQWSLTF